MYVEIKTKPKTDETENFPWRPNTKPAECFSAQMEDWLGIRRSGFESWLSNTAKSQCLYLRKGHNNPTHIDVTRQLRRSNKRKNYMKNCFIITNRLLKKIINGKLTWAYRFGILMLVLPLSKTTIITKKYLLFQ